MKLIQKTIMVLLALLLFACGGGGGSSSSGGGGNNNSTVLPNGSVVTAAQSSVTTFTGGSTSNTVSISGGTTMPVTVNTNSQIQTFNVTAKGKLLSDSGIKVTTNPSPLVLISGGSQSSGQIIIDAAKAATGNYLVNVYGSFTNPNTGQPDSMLIAQFSVSVTQPTPSDVVPGSLSSSPSIINLSESNNKTAEMIVSLDGSQNVNNLAVTIDSDDTGVVLSKSTCTLSSGSNTCQITVNASAATNALANISVKANGYQQTAHTVVHIDDPKPVIVYGTISIVPNSLSLFPQESSSFSITWSGSQNLDELPIVISSNGNVITLNKDSCLLTPTTNSCTVSVTGETVGNTNLTIQVSNPELVSHYPVQNVAVEVNQQAYGNLSLTPQNQAIYVGQNSSLVLTWNDSVGISALPVTVTSSSNDIQLNTTSCNLTAENNSCEIQFSGVNLGSAIVTVTPTNPAQASHFTPQTAMIQVAEVVHNQLLVAMNGISSNEATRPDAVSDGSIISLINSRSQNLPGDVTGRIPYNIFSAVGDDLIVFSNYFNSDANVYRGNSVTGEWRRLGRKALFTINTAKTSVIAINSAGDKICLPLRDENNNFGLYLYNEESNDWDLIPGSIAATANRSSQSMVYRESDLYVLVNSSSVSGHYIAKLSNGAANWESIALPAAIYNNTDALFVDKQNNLYLTAISGYGTNVGPVVYRLNPQTNQWSKLSGDGPDGSIALSYPGYIQYLTSDSQGNLFVTVFSGTQESLYKYDSISQKWSRYGYQSVFYTQGVNKYVGVRTIAIDNSDAVYLTFADGIYKITSANNWQQIVSNAKSMQSIVMSSDGLMNFLGTVKAEWTDLNKQTNAADWSINSIRIVGPKGKITHQKPLYNNTVYVSPFGQKYILGDSPQAGDPYRFTLAIWDNNNQLWLDKTAEIAGGMASATAISTTSSGLTYSAVNASILSLQSWAQSFQMVKQTDADAINLMASDTCGNTYYVTYTNDGHAGIRNYYQINANGEVLPMSSVFTLDSSRENTLATDFACNVYVGTDNGGVYRHNSTAPLSDWQLVVGIPNTSVKKILFNRSNQMYLETYQYPDTKIASYQNNQITYLSMPENKASASDKGNITDFAITYDGNLYAGTDNGNVWQYDFANANWIYTKYGNGMGTFVKLSAN